MNSMIEEEERRDPLANVPFPNTAQGRVDTRTRIIPQDLYEGLPEYLKDMCDEFTRGPERDVFLVGALITISGCLHNVVVRYGNDWFYPQLFGCVLAPAASSKGNMMRPKAIAYAMDHYVLERSKYNIAAVGNPTDELAPKETPMGLLIPGKTTEAAFVQALKSNGGVGLMIEPEIDVLGLGARNSYLISTATYRKVFNHDRIDSATKGNGVNIVSKPKFSLAVSGTPAQVNNLLTSLEDGFFSRILFYSFEPEPGWTSQWTDEEGMEDQLKETMKDLGIDLVEFNKHYNFQHPLRFKLTNKQKIRFDSFFADLLEVYNLHFTNGNDLSASIKRMAIISIRIAMVLTSVRNISNYGKEFVYCEDIDLDTSLKLSNIFINHAVEVADTHGYQ